MPRSTIPLLSLPLFFLFVRGRKEKKSAFSCVILTSKLAKLHQCDQRKLCLCLLYPLSHAFQEIFAMLIEQLNCGAYFPPEFYFYSVAVPAWRIVGG
jgi:hypothetical protein